MEGAIGEGLIVAPREVLFELERVDGDAHAWAKRQGNFFLELDEEVQEAARNVLAEFPELVKQKRHRTVADAFVVAVAQVHGCAVVTNEKATYSPRRPNIPDVCASMSIRCIDLLGLILEMGWVIG